MIMLVWETGTNGNKARYLRQHAATHLVLDYDFLRSLQSGVTSESNRLKKSSGRKRGSTPVTTSGANNFFKVQMSEKAPREGENPEKGNPKRPNRAIGGSGLIFDYGSSFIIQEKIKALCTSGRLARLCRD